MFNVGNHSIRGTIRAKYLLADNVRYKQSRNGLILEFRNFRNKMAALEDVMAESSNMFALITPVFENRELINYVEVKAQ